MLLILKRLHVISLTQVFVFTFWGHVRTEDNLQNVNLLLVVKLSITCVMSVWQLLRDSSSNERISSYLMLIQIS